MVLKNLQMVSVMWEQNIDNSNLIYLLFRWVHIVCALYVPGVAFGDIDKLRPVTLTEMNYSKYGAKVSLEDICSIQVALFHIFM